MATVEDLRMALKETSMAFNQWDQIITGLFLGNAEIAKNIAQLKKEHITHILNAAYIPPEHPDRVFSVGGDEEFYRTSGLKIQFKGLHIIDDPLFDISKFFDDAVDFIDKYMQSGGRVLVHCYVGVSRAATIVIAYLMIKKGYTAVEAATFVGRRRHIHPNAGFLKQLSDLDSQLNVERQKLRRSL